jgi:CRISPR/Cas system-associated endonuclease Cas1
MTYSSNYKKQKPLSKRLQVVTGTDEPQKVKHHPPVKAERQGMPSFMKPVRTSGKQQGVENDTSGDVKDFLHSQGDTQPLSGWEAHAAQLYFQGNDEALDCFD